MPPTLFAADTCSNCKFGQTIKEDLTIVECHGVPPTPVIMGMSPQGPAVSILRCRLPRAEPGCALWKLRPSVADTTAVQAQRV